MTENAKNLLGLRFQNQILFDLQMLKYGLVGCAGIVVNLGTMALLVTLGFGRGWILSAIASLVSTVGNFILHNCWTFSDRQHQGPRFIRGFLSFALISAMGISITPVFYVGFSRMVGHLTMLNSHLGRLGLPLTCQLAAILMAAGASYLLNREFTWPHPQSNPNNAVQIEQFEGLGARLPNYGSRIEEKYEN